MFKELSCVVLTLDLPEAGLQRGDVGTIVMTHQNDEAYEVEFVDENGKTTALVTLRSSQIIPESVQGKD